MPPPLEIESLYSLQWLSLPDIFILTLIRIIVIFNAVSVLKNLQKYCYI